MVCQDLLIYGRSRDMPTIRRPECFAADKIGRKKPPSGAVSWRRYICFRDASEAFLPAADIVLVEAVAPDIQS